MWEFQEVPPKIGVDPAALEVWTELQGPAGKEIRLSFCWKALVNYGFSKCKPGTLLGRRWKGFLSLLLISEGETVPVWVGDRIQ